MLVKMPELAPAFLFGMATVRGNLDARLRGNDVLKILAERLRS